MKKINILILIVLMAVEAIANDRFYIEDFTINPGETKQIALILRNDTVYTAIQTDLYLPEGLTIEQDDGEYIFDLTDRKARNHTASGSLLPTGAVRLLIGSQTNKTFSGNDGALVLFNVIADNSFTGSKTIGIKNTIAAETNGALHYFSDETCHVAVEGSQPPVNEITLDPIMAKLKPGNTLQITATGADNIIWTSSDSSVATVDATGNVTAVKSGLAAITATAPSGAKAWCAIFVYNPGDVNEDNEVNVNDVTMCINIILGKI